MSPFKKVRRIAQPNRHRTSIQTGRLKPAYGAVTADRASGLLTDDPVTTVEPKEFQGKKSRKSMTSGATKKTKKKTWHVDGISTERLAAKGAKGTKGTYNQAGSLKPEKSVTLPNGRVVNMSGMRAADGARYVLVRAASKSVIMPYASWHSGGGEASKALVDGGITIVSSMTDLREAVSQLRCFPNVDVITRPGWSTQAFALVDGRVFASNNDARPLLAFTPCGDPLGGGGTLVGWQEQVALPLAKHDLASFFIMATFAAPLLKLSARADNFGFELAGSPGRGKSTLLMLMASSMGPAVGSDGKTYWATCNTTMNALETTMAQYSDLPLILDEAGLVQGGAKTASRAVELRDMAFRLSSGRLKHRYGYPAGRLHRLVYFLSTNRAIASLLSTTHASEANAIADRIITIPLLEERAYGIFDHVPAGHTSSGLFADALKRAAGEHYGHALPGFLRYLVLRRAKGPKKLGQHIAKYVQKFIDVCGADANDGSQRRVADAFGLVYAAGRLARKAGVLPNEYRPMAATLACYQLHRDHGRVVRSFDDRLRMLMRDAISINGAGADVAAMAGDVVTACRALLYNGRSGSRELLIPVAHRSSVFADWNSIRNGIDVTQRLLTSKGRDTVKRPVGPGGTKVAVYSFDVANLTI